MVVYDEWQYRERRREIKNLEAVSKQPTNVSAKDKSRKIDKFLDGFETQRNQIDKKGEKQ